MNPLASLRAAGFLDALIGRLANIPGRVIRRGSTLTDRAFRAVRGDITGMSGPVYRAWDALYREAISASNAARRAAGAAGTPPPSGPLPIPSGTVGPGSTVEYHVVVVYRDPSTGGTNRVLVVIDGPPGLTRSRLDSLASAAGVTDDHWTDSGKRGDITPASAVYVETVLIGIR